MYILLDDTTRIQSVEVWKRVDDIFFTSTHIKQLSVKKKKLICMMMCEFSIKHHKHDILRVIYTEELNNIVKSF